MNFARRVIMPIMRTTLEIDDDVLQAVKEIAARRKTTAGRVLSDLARQSLEFAEIRNGVPLMPRRPKGSAGLDCLARLRAQPFHSVKQTSNHPLHSSIKLATSAVHPV
jgi:hypothetical protein